VAEKDRLIVTIEEPSATFTATAPAATGAVTFAEAVRFWLKLGCISFGGPTGQIAIMHQELVVRRRWISERRFLHALNFCMLLPGPEAQQLATYIGWLLHGVRGGLAAGALFVLPSLFVLLALSWVYLEFGHISAVAGILYGVKPGVVAIVLFAAWRIGSRTLTSPLLWLIAAAAFAAIFFFRISFPYVVLGAGLVGYVGGRFMPSMFRAAGHGATVRNAYGPALIDDHMPTPSHACWSGSRIALYGAVGSLLWIGTGALLWVAFGWSGTFTQMAWFFSKAALLTFGGAYAVLPYVQQAAVDQFGWLTPTQMIDGLALGETTPGPLIMVVTFVGFVGGWTQAPLGPDATALAGLIGGAVATWFTFLPSFLFIFIGAPLIETTRGDIKMTAPLTAITAAVVGVILNLALYFAGHVLWPEAAAGAVTPAALWGGLDVFAALLGAVAFVAQWRYKVGVIPIIVACAGLGLLRTLS
jgi:chromate transporter